MYATVIMIILLLFSSLMKEIIKRKKSRVRRLPKTKRVKVKAIRARREKVPLRMSNLMMIPPRKINQKTLKTVKRK